MDIYRTLALVLFACAAVVTGLSVLPGGDPPLQDPPELVRRPKIPWPPGPITVQPPPWIEWPPRYCTCEIRCCTHTLQKRRAVSATVNSALVRHKRCCGCHDCKLLSLS